MRAFISILLLGVVSLTGIARGDGLPSFQALVDAAEEGQTLAPPPGVYAGPVVITDPITIQTTESGVASWEHAHDRTPF